MSISYDKTEALSEKRVCAECVGDSYLSNQIDEEGEDKTCDYCGVKGRCISLERLADHVEAAFSEHYARTGQEPNSYEYAMLMDKESSYEWYRKGEIVVEVIADAAQVSEDIANDVQAVLDFRHCDFDKATMGEENEFDADAHYEEIMPSDARWHEKWNEFERLIKTEARFFSRTAAEHLGALFDQIDQMKTHSGQPLVVDAGPDTEYTHLYRARVFHNADALMKAMERPDRELAAPPGAAAAAGRMNARGISVFYGATAPEIALAEVRPPVGSSVAVARFDIVRPLRLLHFPALNALHETGSIFDPDYAHRLGRMMFFRRLANRIARPVMPSDEEMEYLTTQAIADYLSTESVVPLDGILFPSVQVGEAALNAVLFHKAARCQTLDIPKGTELSATTYLMSEDGDEPDYSVTEKVPPPKSKEKNKTSVGFRPFDFDEIDYLYAYNDFDRRQTTLTVKTETLTVHVVKAVSIATTDYPVQRNRIEKRESSF